MFVDYVLFWLPFYYSAKIAFLVWLMHPSTRGAETLWRSLLRGLFLKYVLHIDNFLNDAGAAAAATANVARNAAFAAVGNSGRGARSAPPPLTAATDVFGEAPVPGSKTD